MEVTLEQMLQAREVRAHRQMTLIQKYNRPIVSFCMNIPGPIKDSPLIRRGFFAGCEALENSLPPETILYRQIFPAVTGCEAIYVVNMAATALKTHTVQIEDTHPLGRLFDMDVLAPDLSKLDRELVGGGSRNCIVCGASGRGCASRRTHSVSQLQAAVNSMLTIHFQQEDARKIGELAVQSLLDEVYTTPKPGLVDRNNSGSHRDMNLSTFESSAHALKPYFCRCAAIGMQMQQASAEDTFALLRKAGLQAEQTMFQVTNGVNTHKGAIFTIGLLCAAAGRLWSPEGRWEEDALFRQVSAMTAEAMEADWQRTGSTTGQKLYKQYGIRGIRGEAAQGLPSVSKLGLPTFRDYQNRGLDRNMAGVMTLLSLIAQVEDTNMIARGGLDGAAEGAHQAALLLKSPTLSDILELDCWFIQKNLSPGGCADLLAAVYFVDSLLMNQRNDPTGTP